VVELLRESSSHDLVVEQDMEEERDFFIVAKLEVTCGAPHHGAISVIETAGPSITPGTQRLRDQELLSSPMVFYGERVPSKIRKNSLSENRAFLPSRTMIKSIEGITTSR
jgi:hypothetical protein